MSSIALACRQDGQFLSSILGVNMFGKLLIFSFMALALADQKTYDGYGFPQSLAIS